MLNLVITTGNKWIIALRVYEPRTKSHESSSGVVSYCVDFLLSFPRTELSSLFYLQ